MRKTSLILTPLLALLGASTVAAEPAPQAGPAQVVAGNYNPDRHQLYDPAQGLAVSGPGSKYRQQVAIATPFTVTADVKLRKLSVAMGLISGTNRVTLALAADAGGLPGAVIQSFEFTDLPPNGVCCTTEDVSVRGVKLVAGATYWLAASATASTFAGWNFNNLGEVGNFAFNLGEGWALSTDTRAAFQVTGK